MSPLSTREVLAAAASSLEGAQYQRAEIKDIEDWPTNTLELFEDKYGIVAVCVFETWSALVGGWIECQTRLGELITEHLGRGEPKAWEGYLVLLTPSVLPSDQVDIATKIRYDTTRLRKLIAVGEQLRTVDDVGHSLLSLMPLDLEMGLEEYDSILQTLPELLSKEGIDQGAAETVVRAFTRQESPIEQLHKYRTAT